MNEITKEMFNRYIDVRDSGVYNMVMDARNAAMAARLSPDEYWTIIDNFGPLSEKYGA